jgi:Pectate lyase superfamily protein
MQARRSCPEGPARGARKGRRRAAVAATLAIATVSGLLSTGLVGSSAASAPVVQCSNKPDATNTGASGIRVASKVKALTTAKSKLRNVTLAGALTVAGDGSVVRNVTVKGPIIVTGDHVTLDHVTAERVMVFGASYLTLRRSNLSGGGTAVYVTSNEEGQRVRGVKLTGNFIHDPASAARGSYSGTQLRGAEGVTISCSNYALGAYGRAALLMEDVNGGTAKVTVTKNWLDGGGFTVVNAATRVALRNNTFGKSAKYGICQAAVGEPIHQSRNRTSDGSRLQPCPTSQRVPRNNNSASTTTPAGTATSATPTKTATSQSTLPVVAPTSTVTAATPTSKMTSTVPTTRPSATASSTFQPDAATSTKPAPTASTTAPKNSVNIKDYGAACDGSKDDRVAIRNAIDAIANRGGGIVNIPSGSCRQLQTAASLFTGVGANVTIRGVGPASKLLLACDAANSFRALYRISGDNVTFENLSIIRATPCSGTMIALRPYANTTFRNVIIDGQYQLGGGSMHALLQAHATSGTYRNIQLVGTTIKNMTSYGFLQPNSATTSTDGILVDGCSFTNNGNDDLEFNAPEGTMKNVTVKNSNFSHNRKTSTGGGFGIGLANVQNALLSNNTFEDYNYQPIHIENGTANVTIQDSSFKNAFTASHSWAAHILIISGAHNITVQRNTFDTSSNTNSITAIVINTGGSGYPEPYNMKILNNMFMLRPNAKTTYHSGISDVTISGNTVKNLP